ncbi:Protein OS-9 [Paramyrothecium foliicola]|nr:Protein OS-9 [Paramyrothecium foliicola]
MRRLNFVLLATFRLCGARSRGFSIHEDLVAFPQFDVVFAEDFISEKDAQALLDSNAGHPAYSADFSQPTAGDIGEADSAESANSEGQEPAPEHVYEIMNMAPHQYLCSIPVLQAPEPENQTANELAKAEEARQLSRAAENGWELLNDLESLCLYFMSGWWSYRFCNNREIVQFHAIATLPNGQAPKPDPNSAEYVLGREPAIPASAQQSANQSPEDDPIPAELQVKGDQRYLVQKLVGGTICDLTGRPRTIEVQYHCVPGMKNDRIGWIKEVTICAYLMVVNTPRLCNDVAFLPPKEKKANPIKCQLILDGQSPEPPLLDHSLPGSRNQETAAKEEQGLQSQGSKDKPELVVGGIVIGGRNVLSGADEAGKPPVKLDPPRSFFAKKKSNQDRLTEMIAKAASKEEGGKLEVLSKEELEKLDLSPELVEEMREQMEKIAGDAGWKLEIVEVPGEVRELRGYLDGEDEDEGEGASDKKKLDTKDKTKQKEKKKDEGEGEGSEEKFFKEEL